MNHRHASLIFRATIAVLALVAGFFLLLRAANAEHGAADAVQEPAFTQRVFAPVGQGGGVPIAELRSASAVTSSAVTLSPE